MTVIEKDAYRVVTDWFDTFDGNMLFTGLQASLVFAVPTYLSRGGVNPEQFRGNLVIAFGKY